MDTRFLNFLQSVGALLFLQLCPDSNGQRPNKPIYEYDMNMFDAAELCRKIALTNNKTELPLTTFLHPTNCFFFRWIYCPDEKESESHPCGWWEQTPCDCDNAPHVGHNEQKGTNPEGVHPPPDSFFVNNGSVTLPNNYHNGTPFTGSAGQNETTTQVVGSSATQSPSQPPNTETSVSTEKPSSPAGRYAAANSGYGRRGKSHGRSSRLH